MASHTPAPWIDSKNGIATQDGYFVLWVIGSTECPRKGDYYECSGPRATVELKVKDADKRLMIAAPQLLEALRGIDRLSLVIESAVRNADPTNCAAADTALLAVRAAIAAATGEK